MKKRLIPLALTAVLLLAFGAIAAACGGGGDDDGDGGGALTIEEYFQRLEQLGQDYDDAGNALDEELQGKFESAASEGEQIEVFLDFLDKAVPLVSDFASDLDDLDPPAAVADAHNDAVEAGQELAELFESVIVVAEDTETMADAAALLDAPGFTEASDRFTETCIALQTLADDNSLDVDLRCG